MAVSRQATKGEFSLFFFCVYLFKARNSRKDEDESQRLSLWLSVDLFMSVSVLCITSITVRDYNPRTEYFSASPNHRRPALSACAFSAIFCLTTVNTDVAHGAFLHHRNAPRLIQGLRVIRKKLLMCFLFVFFFFSLWQLLMLSTATRDGLPWSDLSSYL